MTRPREFVARLHASERSGVVALTGGGSLLLSDLLTVPGASSTLLEAHVPYAEASLREYLGFTPQHACSSATARAIAMRAFQRALTLAPGAAGKRFGLAITASLRTTAPKRGKHRAFVVLQTLEATRQWELELAKGERTRNTEEKIVRDLALHAFGHTPPALSNADRLEYAAAAAPASWQALWTSEDATRALGPVFEPRVLFPGAFNPLHEGHRAIAQWVTTRLSQPVTFEICVTNVDKPPLDCLDLEARLTRFQPEESVWLTRLPTFVEKAGAFGGATFVVGTDTIVRVADPRYYGGRPSARDAAIARIAATGTRFLVFGRLVDGRFATLHDLDLPAALVAICDGVSEAEFRQDVSSTGLRQLDA